MMKWTTEPPTKPGFYWCKVEDEASIVEVSEWHAEELDKNLLVVELIGNEEKFILDEILSSEGPLWSGPIPEPKNEHIEDFDTLEQAAIKHQSKK